MGSPTVAIVGGGPAGLMAAEVISQQGIDVELFDAMPSLGRKFLLAGVGGMNITHSEPQTPFLSRYGDRQKYLQSYLSDFSGKHVIEWCHSLGIDTFIGSSGRVFPKDMKAAPLLRAWLHRLRESGVKFHVRHRWLGWDEQQRLLINSPEGPVVVAPKATVFALGGASWPRLGSDGHWVGLLEKKGIEISPLMPANCGFEVDWSAHFKERFAGQALKNIVASCTDNQGQTFSLKGECVITGYGIEGSLIYALSSLLRKQLIQEGQALLTLNLMPDVRPEKLLSQLNKPREHLSLSNYWRRIGIPAPCAGLLREVLNAEQMQTAETVTQYLKAYPLHLIKTRPIEEAISSAGGIAFEAMDDQLMLRDLPGVFCAGEMLDWEAPTGGYLLTACMATGRAAGQGVINWIHNTSSPAPE